MSAHVLLNLLNKLEKEIRCEALPSTNERFYLSYNTKIAFLKFAIFIPKCQDFTIRKCNIFMDDNA